MITLDEENRILRVDVGDQQGGAKVAFFRAMGFLRLEQASVAWRLKGKAEFFDCATL